MSISRKLRLFHLTALLVGPLPFSLAETVPIVNPSFETPDCAAGQCGGEVREFFPLDTTTEGWFLDDGTDGTGGVWAPAEFPAVRGPFTNNIPDGDQAGFADKNVIFSQTLSTKVEANTRYTLSVSVGARPDVTYIEYLVGFSAQDSRSPGGSGTTVFGQTGNCCGHDGPNPAPGTWANVTIESPVYQAGDPAIGRNLRIVLINTAVNQVSWDNVRVTKTTVKTTIPPPVDEDFCFPLKSAEDKIFMICL